MHFDTFPTIHFLIACANSHTHTQIQTHTRSERSRQTQMLDTCKTWVFKHLYTKCCFDWETFALLFYESEQRSRFILFTSVCVCVCPLPSPNSYGAAARHKSPKRWQSFRFASATFTVNKTLLELAKWKHSIDYAGYLQGGSEEEREGTSEWGRGNGEWRITGRKKRS